MGIGENIQEPLNSPLFKNWVVVVLFFFLSLQLQHVTQSNLSWEKEKLSIECEEDLRTCTYN